jgi:hypothetical protein
LICYLKGQFAKTTKKEKKNAKGFIDEARRNGNIASAAATGSQRTVQTNREFHLDRQTPTTASGHKVAVQKNKGSPSTIGQVKIPPQDITQPSPKLVSEFMTSIKQCVSSLIQVAKRLSYSVLKEKETAAYPSQKSVAHDKRVAERKAAKEE